MLKALYIAEGISSSTTSVQHPSDDATAAILRQNAPPHISYRWRGDRVMKTIRAMMVRGQWANLASIQYYSIRLHPYSFWKDILGFLMTTESQDLGLTSHPNDGAFYSIPSLHWGVRTHTDHRVSTPCWSH